MNTPSGKVGLDEYVLLQAKRLVTECNISVESAPSKIGNGSVGTVVYKITSPEYPSIGKLKYKAELIGAGISPIKGSGSIDAGCRREGRRTHHSAFEPAQKYTDYRDSDEPAGASDCEPAYCG